MTTLAQLTDTGASSQTRRRRVGSPELAPAGQVAMPWAPAQLGLDGRAYAPPANEPEAGGEAPVAESILGPYTDFVTKPQKSGSERRWERQRTMWDIFGPQRTAQGEIDFSTGERVAKCRKVRLPKPDQPTPELERTEFGSWDITGTVRCGNAHACPMCAFTRARTAVSVLATCIDRHLNPPPDFHRWAVAPDVWMLTLTTPHQRGEGFRAVVDRLTAAWRVFTRSREWRSWCKRFGVIGVVRCWDDTIGSNGLHGHFHVGLFVEHSLFAGQPLCNLDKGTREIAYAEFSESLRDAWVRALFAAGAPAVAGVKREAMRELGLHLAGGEKSAAYLASWGAPEELALETAKGGRTHWALLDEARAGDYRAAVEFAEYYEATRGLAVITGLKQLQRTLGVTDEIVDAHVDELVMLRELQAAADGKPLERVRPLKVTIAPWYWSCAIGAGWHAVCRVADAADAAGVDVQSAVDGFLESHAFT